MVYGGGERRSSKDDDDESFVAVFPTVRLGMGKIERLSLEYGERKKTNHFIFMAAKRSFWHFYY